MKTRKITSFVLMLVMLTSLLSGCGASSSGSVKSEAAMNYAMDSVAEAPMAVPMVEDMGGLSNSTRSGTNQGSSPAESQKWIITYNMTAETDNLDTLSGNLNKRINELNGYVEVQHVYNGSTHSNKRYRNASWTIRIPEENVVQFTDSVDGMANVVSKEKNMEDITLRYVATESRMNALKTEETRLLELLAQAEDMGDLLQIESRLTDVRYELENNTSQLRYYDNKIDYATVYLNIDEVQEYTPIEEPTVWERIRDGFSGSLKGLGKGFVNLAVWLIVASPYLVVWGIVIAVIVLFVKRMEKNRKKKNENKEN